MVYIGYGINTNLQKPLMGALHSQNAHHNTHASGTTKYVYRQRFASPSNKSTGADSKYGCNDDQIQKRIQTQK